MAAGSKQRTRTNDPAAMRGRILDAAAELFQDRGYNDSSMQDIIRAAGTSAGALHHHFPSKKALGLAVVRERVADALRKAWLEPLNKAPAAVDGIMASLDGITSALRRQGRVRGCPVNNLAVEMAFADEDFRGALQPMFDEWRRAIATRLHADDAAAPVVGAGADEFALLIVAAYSGAMTMSKTAQSAEPLEVTSKMLLTLLSGRASGARA